MHLNCRKLQGIRLSWPALSNTSVSPERSFFRSLFHRGRPAVVPVQASSTISAPGKLRGSRKCLIISGARQNGKTYIVRAFARQEYDSFIELNFLEAPSLK